MKKKLLLILLGLLVIAQFIRPDRSTPPPAPPEQDFLVAAQVDQATGVLLRTACYDCHSNETVYPWYVHITPVNFWLQSHVNEAREELNFSTWGGYSKKRIDKKLKEMKHEISEGDMPLPSYTWLHAGARLSSEERTRLIDLVSGLQGVGR